MSPATPFVQRLLEHLHPGHHHLALRRLKPTISISRPVLTMPALDPPGHHRAAPLDPEHVLDRHQERLVDRPLRRRDVVVHRLHQLPDRRVLRRRRVGRCSLSSAASALPRTIGMSSPGKLVG